MRYKKSIFVVNARLCKNNFISVLFNFNEFFPTLMLKTF